MKTQFITLFTLLSVSIIFAQDSEVSVDSKSFDFGIRHGYIATALSNENGNNTNQDIYFGLFATKRLSEKFSLQIETNIRQYSVIEIPLLLKYKLTNKFDIY
ncbi:hypothetical protein [Algibacter lectus]|uniref:hypothetical protein n=1 Tax=Algibacter lectus TaxID=221126 RepID=UPI00106361AE|nr:hypothetical protein [Algibacter lectus]MWW23233.1 hypothetical protein [Algibacter lectus]